MCKFYVYALLDSRNPGKFTYGEYIFDYEPFYIGKGCGDRIKTHWYKHVYSRNTPKNNKIRKIIESGNMEISVKLKDNLSESDSLMYEIELIKTIGRKDLNIGPLLNLTNGGETCMGVIRDDKYKTPVVAISTIDDSITNYPSITEAANINNISKGNILNCCKGKICYYKGFIWQYQNELLYNEYLPFRENIINRYKIKQYINNTIVIFDSIKEAAIYNDISETCVIYSCQGKTGKNSKYNFEYLDINKNNLYKEKRAERNLPNLKEIPIIQLDMDMNVIQYWSSATKAAKELLYNASCITSCCKGRRKTAYKFKWVYK